MDSTRRADDRRRAIGDVEKAPANPKPPGRGVARRGRRTWITQRRRGLELGRQRGRRQPSSTRRPVSRAHPESSRPDRAATPVDDRDLTEVGQRDGELRHRGCGVRRRSSVPDRQVLAREIRRTRARCDGRVALKRSTSQLTRIVSSASGGAPRRRGRPVSSAGGTTESSSRRARFRLPGAREARVQSRARLTTPVSATNVPLARVDTMSPAARPRGTRTPASPARDR